MKVLRNISLTLPAFHKHYILTDTIKNTDMSEAGLTGII